MVAADVSWAKDVSTDELLSICDNNSSFEHIQADILFFIYSQIRKSGVQTTVVIDAEDTDVLVLAACVANTVDGILTIKRKQNIIDCRTLCSKEISDIIIPLHIHNASDTTTAFFAHGAHGKTTIFDKGTSSDDARSLLSSIGKTLPVTQAVLDDVAMSRYDMFTIRFIYNDKISKSLGEARARKWNQMKKRKSTLTQRPDRDSLDIKTNRVNYQTYLLMNYDQPCAPPSPDLVDLHDTHWFFCLIRYLIACITR